MIGEVIRITRVANDMSISKLSKKSTVSKSYITEIEKGKKVPSDKILSKLSQAFDLTEEQIKEFDDMHNMLIQTREKLNAYRALLISILEFYNNREMLRLENIPSSKTSANGYDSSMDDVARAIEEFEMASQEDLQSKR